MPLSDRLRQELDRAGKALQGAVDEGRLRLDAFRARQLADRAAQTLGYAVLHSRSNSQSGGADAVERLVAALAEREAEANRLEAKVQASGRGVMATAPLTQSADAVLVAVVLEGDASREPGRLTVVVHRLAHDVAEMELVVGGVGRAGYRGLDGARFSVPAAVANGAELRVGASRLVRVDVRGASGIPLAGPVDLAPDAPPATLEWGAVKG